MPLDMTQTAEIPAEELPPGHYQTAAQWWESLGCVPLERIVFNPPPGTATEQDVVRLDAHEDRICELIDGTLVEKTMGYEESLIAIRIAHLLSVFVIPRKLGLISGEAGMLRILKGRVRIPDVAFVSAARFPDGKPPRGPIPAIAPDLAVEVLSDSNTRKEMALKLQEYFSAGTQLVWYVDPKSCSVDVYTSPDRAETLSGDAILTGGDVLPGFQTPVSAIFKIA
jgi:Uma2 family endonuclease